MTLRLYNTLTRTKEVFTPIDPKNVRMYVCGPTVYDFAHIGNARPVIVFDVLFRLLRHLYGADHVKYVRNITDVDDKINARALRDFPDLPLNDAIRRVTEKTANQFDADVKALGCLEPTFQPRATEHIQGMIDIISTLIKKGNAYVAAGEVLFDVGSMPDYGRLSQRKQEDQKAGARVAVEAHKKNPADFVLWKLSAADEPGWESPWGRGRPGWHIECSAMSVKHLGETFDIHGGGLDLIFPHHENEIAQSRCAHGTSVMAKVWMHNGFLQVEGKKMSKSDGNFFTIADVLAEYPGEVVRFNMLRTHYRQPIDWTVKAIEDSQDALFRFLRLRNTLNPPLLRDDYRQPSNAIRALLEDDLNTAGATNWLEKLASQGEQGDRQAIVDLVVSCGFLGIHFDGIVLPEDIAIVNQAEIDDLVNSRLAARTAKNWSESDRIRDELAAMGIQIKDNKDGTTSWEVKR
jgi:cysteinyl-tRNA synthetase